jgi:ParB-like chromosome segregation protein Spo0J
LIVVGLSSNGRHPFRAFAHQLRIYSMIAAPASATQRTIVSNTLTTPTITIDPDLERLLPALPPEDFANLKADIEANGVRDCLLIWRSVDEDGNERRTLVDGHNRYRVWKAVGRDPEQLPVEEKEFEDRTAVESWMITNQLMRRNLTDEQRRHFRGLAYEAAKDDHGGDRKSSGQSDHLKTATRLAEQFGVSEKTIRRDAAFARWAETLSPEDKAQALAGNLKMPKPEKTPTKTIKEKAVESTQAGTIATDGQGNQHTESGVGKSCPKQNTADESIEEAKEISVEPTDTPATDKAVIKASEAEPKDITVCTVGDLSRLTFTEPNETALALFRVLGKAEDYLKALPDVTEAQQKSLLSGYQRLRGIFGGLMKTVENKLVQCVEDSTVEGDGGGRPKDDSDSEPDERSDFDDDGAGF